MAKIFIRPLSMPSNKIDYIPASVKYKKYLKASFVLHICQIIISVGLFYYLKINK